MGSAYGPHGASYATKWTCTGKKWQPILSKGCKISPTHIFTFMEYFQWTSFKIKSLTLVVDGHWATLREKKTRQSSFHIKSESKMANIQLGPSMHERVAITRPRCGLVTNAMHDPREKRRKRKRNKEIEMFFAIACKRN